MLARIGKTRKLALVAAAILMVLPPASVTVRAGNATTNMGSSTVFFDDFSSYTPGLPPIGYLLRGTSAITPTVEEVGGIGPAYRVLDFPDLPFLYDNRWALKDGLTVSAPYTVTAKINFQESVADRAGITIAWNDQNENRIDIQPNVYWQDVEFHVTYTGPVTSNVQISGPATTPGGLQFSAGTDYWLRVSATSNGPGQGQVIVYWSSDNIAFTPVVTATGLADLTGLVGLGTAGPHLPHVYFDDLKVDYTVAPPPPTDTPVPTATPSPLPTLPAPTWWAGTACDSYHFRGQTRFFPTPLAQYRNVVACSPRPFWAAPTPGATPGVDYDILERFYPRAVGEYEWECVEYAMRFMYLAYQQAPWYLHDNHAYEIVSSYRGHILAAVVPGPGIFPQPGDVLAYKATRSNPFGHTSVVTASSVDAQGNGYVWVIEQNGSPTGRSVLRVTNWQVANGNVTGWLHYPGPIVTATATPTAASLR